ncbi:MULTISPECIES: GntR family transcriptional regulator [Bacillus]|uniref:Transcriptional regulator n=2 Tax=Bacillus TaxID=1386 RepID=A0A0M4FRR8_9BACI|nr:MULTISPECIES: GntR family transcriptional regulator [Bacillus]ALC80505.1 transcriptional regulator [Bacillus gobiensis]MBP1083577.1 GntR family transcriptional regulator [Bacillus capparidis]MED1094770.1 GntR family transcriptional regulator [Bacillus capparidis]
MAKNYSSSKPIYMQIAEQVFKQVVRGELKQGDKLPSVREMAIQTGVNPNTIQRTYSEMERMGIVETRRGQGTFLAENNQIILDLKEKMKNEATEEYVNQLKELGLTQAEMLEGLEAFLKKGNPE